MTKRRRPGKLKILEVATDAQIAQGEYCVCGGAGDFLDDVQATCARCDVGIVHRPHVPDRLIKICVACYVEMRSPDDTYAITQKTVDEVLAFVAELRKKPN